MIICQNKRNNNFDSTFIIFKLTILDIGNVPNPYKTILPTYRNPIGTYVPTYKFYSNTRRIQTSVFPPLRDDIKLVGKKDEGKG